jgi:hypothetical protein
VTRRFSIQEETEEETVVWMLLIFSGHEPTCGGNASPSDLQLRLIRITIDVLNLQLLFIAVSIYRQKQSLNGHLCSLISSPWGNKDLTFRTAGDPARHLIDLRAVRRIPLHGRVRQHAIDAYPPRYSDSRLPLRMDDWKINRGIEYLLHGCLS